MKRILITGANRGIGYGFTEHFLARGNRVFATCRQPDRADDLKGLRERYPDNLTIVPLDVTDADEIKACHQAVATSSEALDLLINNAGVLFASERLADIDPGNLAASFAVNTIAPLMVIREFLPLLKKAEQGVIVNITMPTRPITQHTRHDNHAYIASRYALNGLTKMVALELADTPVTTVALWPGYIRTDMNNHAPAATPIAEAIPLATDVIDAITPEQNGVCLMPDGTSFDW